MALQISELSDDNLICSRVPRITSKTACKKINKQSGKSVTWARNRKKKVRKKNCLPRLPLVLRRLHSVYADRSHHVWRIQNIEYNVSRFGRIDDKRTFGLEKRNSNFFRVRSAKKKTNK